nr:glycosyltransferase family 2 protein [Clostridia bacterium]
MQFEKGLVSVIIPVYNREAYVEECISSVLAQSYSNFEVIIVDDGSSDNSAKICENLAEKDNRVKVFYGEHAGVSAARNKAIEKACGEYLFFIDSDDIIHNRLFETFVGALEKSGADIAGTRVVNVGSSNWNKALEKASEKSELGKTEFKTNGEALEETFSGTTPLSCIGGTMMRRTLVGDTAFRTDVFIGEDFSFIYDNLMKGADCIFLSEKWYYTRIHSNNSSWVYGFDGFWTRFYRRKLVWESEERLGRKKYAELQKKSAFACYGMCLERNKWNSEDCRKMRKVLREHAKQLLPALSAKGKLLYCLCVCFPPAHAAALKIIKHIKAKRK